MGFGGSRAKVYDEDTPDHPVLRHRRLRGGQAGGGRGGRLPEPSRALRPGGGDRPPWRAHGGPTGHRQDAHGPGRGRRGRGALPGPHRVELRRAVRGGRGITGAGPLRRCPQAGPVDHLHRRDRRHRPAPGWVHRLQRRAGADPQPAPGRDGRLRPHAPGWWSWPPPTGPRCSIRPCCDRAASTARSRSRCPTRPSGPPSWPCTSRASTWPPTSTSTPWPGPPRGSRGPTWPISSTRRPSSPSATTATSSSPATSTRPGTGSSSAGAMPPTPSCPRRSTRWPCTSPGTPWSPSSPSMPTRWPRSPSCRPAGPSGSPSSFRVDERHLYPESYLLDSLAVRLGGRASENLVIGEASTGAANDLSGATQLAIKMVTEWGLSPRLGPIGYGSDGPAYLERSPTRPGAPLRRGDPAGHRPGGEPPAHRGRGPRHVGS